MIRKARILALIFLLINIILLIFGFFGEHSLSRYKINLVCNDLSENVYSAYATPIGMGFGTMYSTIFNFEPVKYPLCKAIILLWNFSNPGWSIILYLISYLVLFSFYFSLSLIFLIIKDKISKKLFLIFLSVIILILIFSIISFLFYNPCWNLKGSEKSDCLNAFAFATINLEKDYCFQNQKVEEYCISHEKVFPHNPSLCLEEYTNQEDQRKCFMRIASDCSCWLRPIQNPQIKLGYDDQEDHICCNRLKEISPVNLVISW